MFVKTFKKTISLFMAVVFILSLAPVIGMAEEKVTGSRSMLNPRCTRGNNATQSGTPYEMETYNGTYLSIRGDSNNRHGYAQLDFSGYEEILQNPGTTVAVTLHGYGSTGKYCINDFTMTAYGDEVDSYINSSLTYNKASALGMNDPENGVILYVRSDANGIDTITIPIETSVITTLLNGGSDNSVVTVEFSDLNAKRGAIYHTDKSGEIYEDFLNITYLVSEINNDAYVAELSEKLTWDVISDDEITSAANDLNLPTKFYGADVTWTSTDEDIINPSSGEVTASRIEDKTVVLEATISYSGISDEISTKTVPFEVTVPKTEPKTVDIKVSEITCLQSRNANEAGTTTSYYMTNKGMFNTDDTKTRGDELVFAKWELTDYMEILDVAIDISIEIKNTNKQGASGVVTVLPDMLDDWTKAELTYNDAINKGMYTDPGLHSEYDVPFNVDVTTISSAELTEAIKTAVAQGPDDNFISVRITSGDSNLNKFKGTPYLKITYYEDDVLSGDDFLAQKGESMPWSAVSSQDIDNVVSNLKLPATYYGADVTWISSDESVISSSGEVTIGDSIQTVTLTATVAGTYTNTFTVTVAPSSIAVQSGNMNAEKSGTRYNYSTAYVYANETVNETPDVIIATYKDDVLVDVSVKENATINEGLNVFPSGYYQVFSDLTTKTIIVDDMTTLNPLTVAK